MRVVSLVPSATESLLALGIIPIACTRFCEQPGIPTVGGTKNPDLDAIRAARPDLVVMNDEENRRPDFEALIDAGVAVHSMSPRAVAEVGPAVTALADAVSVPIPAPFGAEDWQHWIELQVRDQPSPRRRGATLIWRRPWMALGPDTYGSSVLELLGDDNVVAGDPHAEPNHEMGDRYPELTLAELAAYEPQVVLLPDEPYVFTEHHRDEVSKALPGTLVRLVDGRDLFWWGTRTPDAVDRLRARS